MSDQVWINNRQPQTLYIAQVLMYFRGGMAILFGGLIGIGRVSLLGSTVIGTLYLLLLTVGLVAGAYGIANEKWGYQLGVAGAPFLIRLQLLVGDGLLDALTVDSIGLVFDVALVALLLHPMSSDIQKCGSDECSALTDPRRGCHGRPRQSPDRQENDARSARSSTSPRYDLVNRIMSFGLDVRWRKASMKKLGAKPGSVILDLACGTGDFCREIEKQGMVAVGLDLSMGMLAAARTDAPLTHADILAMPLADGSVDGATCGFALRNLIELEGFFEEVARVVRPGGRIAFVDASPPENPVLRLGHGLYFNKVVPVIGDLLSGDGRTSTPQVGRLPATVAELQRR